MPTFMGNNTIVDIKNFLGTKDRPVDMDEFAEFWKSLSEEEKEELRKTPLS